MGNTNVKPHPKPRSKKQLRWKATERPLPPGKPSLVEDNGSIPDVVHICWTKPQNEGGSTVTSYLVEHRRVGNSHWLQSSSQPIEKNELTVSGLEPGWRYQFRVRAQNAVGLSDPSEISEPFTVTLQRSTIAAPKFTQELQDIVALENDKVEFEIHFLGQPSPNICWFKNGFEIFSGNRTRITTLNNKSILTIMHASIPDEGEIKCTATNKAGHTSTKCKLTVDAPPSIKLPKSYQDQDGIIFEIGETIKMNVTVSGKPTPLIFWSHDGESIRNSDRYEIEYNDQIASVKIENGLRSDRGEYRIKAVNKLGQDQAAFLVTITDKPTPPGKARVLLTSGRSVTLCWSTPKDDGGCRVGSYIIEYYRIGWDVWLKAATTRQQSTMLGDLIEGSQYKFRVKAESPFGVSDPSEESEVVFIADEKRGIQEPSDIKQIDRDSQIPVTTRRRAQSTPRVSFVLDDDAPVRPERKKTGKTPEASPRFKRKPYPVLSRNNIGSEPSLNRKFSIPYSISSPGDSPRVSWDNSLIPDSQSSGRERPINIMIEKHKSPSPEIIITDTDKDEKINVLRSSAIFNRSGRVSTSPVFSGQSHTEEIPANEKRENSASKTSKNSVPVFKSQDNSTLKLKKSPSGSANHFDKSPSRSPIHFDKPLCQSAIEIENTPTRSPEEHRESVVPQQLKISPSRNPSKFEKSPPKIITHFDESPSRRIENSPPKSPEVFQNSPSTSPEHGGRSPSRSPYHFEKSPSRSPEERIPLGTSNFPLDNNMEKLATGIESESNMNGRNFEKNKINLGESMEMKKHEERSSHKSIEREKHNSNSSSNMNRMRPPLTHQQFSGSSEFMLVLCPEGEQSTPFKKFGISFDDNSIPPPLSLSAPELGIEPPEQPFLKRWSSSTELLTIRLMERLHEAVMNENETNSGHSNVPQIQVNSEPATELNSEEKSTLSRRLSGVLPNIPSAWSNRRHSLKNVQEVSDIFGTRLRKFEETDQIKRDILDYRAISESEHEDSNTRREEWMMEYEESIPSEEESEPSSSDERKLSEVTRNEIEEEDLEIYNPRNRMMTAVKANDNQPFEILTVRKNPPNSNIVPKPILKKSFPNDKKPNHSITSPHTIVFEANTSPPEFNKEGRIPKRRRSNSLGEVESEIDIDQIKRSPTPGKRRSFSLIPSQANFMKDVFKAKNQKDTTESVPDSRDAGNKNISALANFTSIAGAGLIIPKEMQQKREASEEAKVAVDFYGDIVKSFGGKSKPTAEFSRTVVSKYDTYEERKISDIKPNSDSLAIHARPISPKSPEVNVIKYAPNVSDGERSKSPLISPIKQFDNRIQPPTDSKVMQTDISKNANHSTHLKYYQEAGEYQKRERIELANKTAMYGKDLPTSSKSITSDSRKDYRGINRSSRPAYRQSSAGRIRRKTPMSRDASTSPVRFSDDWDSQCSSKNSLEQDYYNKGSRTSSRASSLSRRSLSPPRRKLRGITTQTSFRIESESAIDVQQRQDIAKKAERRMSVLFGFCTDAAMIGVAGWLYVYDNEYLAIPFIVIPIYRQLDDKIKRLGEGIKRRIPKWIMRRFEKKS